MKANAFFVEMDLHFSTELPAASRDLLWRRCGGFSWWMLRGFWRCPTKVPVGELSNCACQITKSKVIDLLHSSSVQPESINTATGAFPVHVHVNQTCVRARNWPCKLSLEISIRSQRSEMETRLMWNILIELRVFLLWNSVRCVSLHSSVGNGHCTHSFRPVPPCWTSLRQFQPR